MHQDAFQAVQTFRPPHVTQVYEVGSLDINGSVRPLFHDAKRYHGIDAVPGPSVDVVADGVSYVPPFTPDCVVCCEVLEHTPAAAALVQQLGQVVAAGGVVIVTCAGPGRMPHSGVDGGPVRPGEYYANVAEADLTTWMLNAGLKPVRVVSGEGAWGGRKPGSVQPGDVYAVGYKP